MEGGRAWPFDLARIRLYHGGRLRRGSPVRTAARSETVALTPQQREIAGSAAAAPTSRPGDDASRDG
ncbi:hypothetical protein [Streptomyces sp. NBC_01233]|uniref:hypothetical protein n=1 Tax=Streptomyces sp. NBC_01233 TaxID=2903787 RepID=UPI002E1007FE|nr:hypothetical protein OG332_44260 [Streptomyces sp. NBC_01233]